VTRKRQKWQMNSNSLLLACLIVFVLTGDVSRVSAFLTAVNVL